MAMETIDDVAVRQFSSMVHVKAEQMRARLRGVVKIIPMTGKDFAYDGLGAAEAAEISGRHQPVTFTDIEHTRRKIARRRFVLTLPIDAADARSILLNPQSEYAGACARAMERVFDRIVVESLFATVYTGENFGTSVTFATDGGSTVTATAGLTYVKLLAIKKNFTDNEVGTDTPEQFCLGISGDEEEALMQEQELVSGDYSRQYVIDEGEIVKAAGFKLVKFGGAVAAPILDVTAGVRSCFAMSSRGMVVGLSKNMTLKVEPRPDLIETQQVQIIYDLGATRTEGVLVQKVTTTDT